MLYVAGDGIENDQLKIENGPNGSGSRYHWEEEGGDHLRDAQADFPPAGQGSAPSGGGDESI